MTENAMFRLTTVQSFNGENDKIELETKGNYTEKDGKKYVRYEESEMTGFDETTTTIKISDDEIVMIRHGKFKSRMSFKLGDTRLCNYETPYGVIPVAVKTLKIDSSLSDNGGNLSLEYILELDNKNKAINALNLNVKKLS